MRRNYAQAAGVTVLVFLLWGCGLNYVKQGSRAISHGNYAMAEASFQQELLENPGSFEAKRGLGQVYYHMKDYDKATEYLTETCRERPRDVMSTLYLGLTNEARDDYEGAENVYAKYLGLQPKSRTARQIRGRLLYVRNEALRLQVKRAIEFEEPLVTDTSGAVIVGVLPFSFPGAEVQLRRSLAVGLAAAVYHDLSRVSSIRLVERMQLKHILDELALVEASITTVESSPELGKLIGASHLISGSLGSPSPEHVFVQSGIVDVAESAYDLAFDSEEQIAHLLRLQKQLSFAVIDSLGIQLTASERRQLEKPLTVSFEAFLAYSQGLEQLDQKNYRSALEYFDQAASLDPGFEDAVALQEETGLLLDGTGSIDEFETFVISSLPFTLGDTPGYEEDILDLNDPTVDPRTDDDPIMETGTLSVSGSIR